MKCVKVFALFAVVMTLCIGAFAGNCMDSAGIAIACPPELENLKIVSISAVPPASELQPAASIAEPQDVFAAGISGNPGANAPVAGAALYAHKLAEAGTYSFTMMDILPNADNPGTVTTNLSTGVAQRVLTVGKLPIYVAAAAGLSVNAGSTGWSWTGGGLTSIRWKQTNFRIMPGLRVAKSSVSNGTGYQLIPSLLFGWGR